jgi:hypothetical protein
MHLNVYKSWPNFPCTQDVQFLRVALHVSSECWCCSRLSSSEASGDSLTSVPSAPVQLEFNARTLKSSRQLTPTADKVRTYTTAVDTLADSRKDGCR